MKKLIAILLALSIVFTVPCMAFASSEPNLTADEALFPNSLRDLLFTLPFLVVISPLLFATEIYGSVYFLITGELPFDVLYESNELLHVFDFLPLPEIFDKPFR